MATKELCDKCEKESPDDKGLNIINGWYELVVTIRSEKNMYSDNRRKVLLCEDCFDETGLKKCNWEYYR